ncbi:MAG: hypothetical protein WCT36_05005, partial [Candidatus Gracilibacteria bacterium]
NKPKVYVFNKMDLVNLAEMEEAEKKESSEESIEPEPKPRTNGILRAGVETARLLGWLNKDADLDELKNPKPTIKNLKHNYKKFSPVFVSAYAKTNLDTLIKKVSDILGKI